MSSTPPSDPQDREVRRLLDLVLVLVVLGGLSYAVADHPALADPMATAIGGATLLAALIAMVRR